MGDAADDVEARQDERMLDYDEHRRGKCDPDTCEFCHPELGLFQP